MIYGHVCRAIVEKGTAKETVSIRCIPMPRPDGLVIVPESGLRGVKLAAIPGVPPISKKSTFWLRVCAAL